MPISYRRFFELMKKYKKKIRNYLINWQISFLTNLSGSTLDVEIDFFRFHSFFKKREENYEKILSERAIWQKKKKWDGGCDDDDESESMKKILSMTNDFNERLRGSMCTWMKL